jgi:hypothetical protein
VVHLKAVKEREDKKESAEKKAIQEKAAQKAKVEKSKRLKAYAQIVYEQKDKKGYCKDYQYLKGGSYPPRRDAEADPVQECAVRCRKDYGNKIQGVYLRDSDKTCGCSKGACATVVNSAYAVKKYTSYAVQTKAEKATAEKEKAARLKEYEKYEYTKRKKQGFCKDWKYLKAGGYPPRQDPEADPVKECAVRCAKDYGKVKAVYLRNSDKTCACSKGACTKVTGNEKYVSYAVHTKAEKAGRLKEYAKYVYEQKETKGY